MLVGIIGPYKPDIDIIGSVFSAVGVQVIDGNGLVRSMPRTERDRALYSDGSKLGLIDSLNTSSSLLAITGNVLFNEAVASRFTDEDDTYLIILGRKSLEDYPDDYVHEADSYWGSHRYTEWTLTVRYQELYSTLASRHSDRVCWVDRYIQQLDSNQGLMSVISKATIWADRYVKPTINVESLWGDKNMTIEESIRKAMSELGIEPPDKPLGDMTGTTVERDEAPSASHDSPDKDTDDKNTDNKPEQLAFDFDAVADEPEPEPEPEPETKAEPVDVYVKVDDDTMAIIVPSDIDLETRMIGDTSFRVLSISLPDLDVRSLQSVSLVSGATGDAKPTTKEPTTKKPTKEPVDSTGSYDDMSPDELLNAYSLSLDVDQLTELKKALDKWTRYYGKSGDDERHQLFRKERRKVRNRINSLSR